MRTKISDFISYKQFLEKYLVNHEEFQFYYKDRIINICYGKNGTFSYNIVRNYKVVFSIEFSTPQEVLENIEIDNIKFPELWELLE